MERVEAEIKIESFPVHTGGISYRMRVGSREGGGLLLFERVESYRNLGLDSGAYDRFRRLGLGDQDIVGDIDHFEPHGSDAPDESWERKGIGAALLQRMVADARANGIKFIYGVTEPQNVKARRFLGKHGFQEEETSGECGDWIAVYLSIG